VADGPVTSRAQHLPGEEAWLVGEHRATGERKYDLTNHSAEMPLEALAALIKAALGRRRPAAPAETDRWLCHRWVCEQMHQQLKAELGLDHFEGRSWRGLHHHALLCQLAFAFLQHLRLGGKKHRPSRRVRTAATAEPAHDPAAHLGRAHSHPASLPALQAALRSSPPALNVAV
jgi:hypothetical protein